MSEAHLLVTFGMVTYNQERFIGDALRGAFSQTYSPLEIVICDDCSTDDTVKIIREVTAIYGGQHTVHVHQNEVNIGFGENLNRLMTHALGEIIVVAAGDDVSLPCRVQRLISAYEASDQRSLSLFSNATVIDAAGVEEGLYIPSGRGSTPSALGLARGRASAIGCAQAWHRSLFEVFGPLQPGVVHEDHVIPFRASLLGRVEYLDEPLVMYRRHDANMHMTYTKQIRDAGHYLVMVGRQAESNVVLYENMLADVHTVCRLYPEREAELEHLELGVSDSLRDMQCERDLFKLGRPARARLIAQAFRRGTQVRRTARWVLWFLLPEGYFAWLRFLSVARRSYAGFRRLRGASLTWSP